MIIKKLILGEIANMKIFYKYYYIFLITLVVIATLLGVYKGSYDALSTIKTDKVIVKSEEIKKEVENINNKSSKTDINKDIKNKEIAITDNRNQEVQIKKTEEKVDSSGENTISVFKVSKNEIANQYTSLEKLEMLSILKIKLNEENYKAIESLLYSNEKDIDILKKINLVLKNNLDKKDYNKVLQLAGRVVNVELVNGK